MIPVGILGSARVAAGSTAVLTYVDGVNSGTSQTTHTLLGRALGTPDPSRTVLLALTLGAANTTTSTVTIGGVTATLDGTAATSDGSNRTARVYRASVPSGATGDVVVTLSGAATIGVDLWSIPKSLTQVDTKTALVASAAQSTTLTGGAYAVHLSVLRDTTNSRTVAWTGPTKDRESGTITNFVRASAASGSLSATATWNGTVAGHALLSVSYS